MRAQQSVLLVYILAGLFSCNFLQGECKGTYKDFEYIFSGVYKPETFYGKNITWLNNNNSFDQVYYSRHTLDLSLNIIYGQETYESKIAEFLMQVRNKAVWGNPESIASTTEADVKILETINGTHKHGFPRNIFWIRQGWLQFNINETMSVPFRNIHTFTIGIFPFQLGRGIALGDAYAVGPEILGFYNDGAIDQYAPGARFSGEIVSRILAYDLYVAILQNNSSNLGDTGKKIFGQEYGRLDNPTRGFGSVNFLFAGRFNWTVFDNERLGRMILEPYAVYNSDPEQKIEFKGDATSKLGTIGLAHEYYGKRFECGFDYAVNFGQQFVKGWDRNVIKENNRGGVVTLVNDNVTVTYKDNNDNVVTEQAPFVSGSQAQKIINTTDRDQDNNGQIIGTVPSYGYLQAFTSGDVVLKNSPGRFGDAYKNKYEGWMFVADASYATKNKDIVAAATFGIASGDDNPNFETKDGKYSGFISLQEMYSGKRVRSVFLLGGAGKVKRLLSTPNSLQAPSREAQAISGFTNLVFFGTSLKWKPNNWKKAFELNPNVLSFWQEKPIGNARTYLGTEAGLFINYNMLKDLKLFWVSSLFFPGSHYADRMGLPVITDAIEQDLASEEDTGNNITQDRIAKLGKNVAYTFNLGLIYSF